MLLISRHPTSRLLLLLSFHHSPTRPSSHRLHSLQAPTFPLPSPRSVPLPPESILEGACSLVSRAYEDGDRKLRSFQMELSREQALCVVSLLAEREGSMVALSFFHWAIARPEFRHFMRLFLMTASALVLRGNLEKAREVMRCMVLCFSEIGKFGEAVDMVFEMRNQGMRLDVHIMNYILRVAVELGLVDYAHNLFDGMPLYGALPDFVSFKTMITGYCNAGRVLDVEKLLIVVEGRGFRIDNVTCTKIVEAFSKKGMFGKVFGVFRKMSDMGLPPNVINYTALIDGLCKRGSVKQAFQVLEEMVGKGMKPNVYTHTSLIDGLCKIGWTERAFRLFLKLVRSESYKPNVQTYTAMIAGYCKERKLGRAEMLLARMREQGLAPNTNTYTTLIDGYCKEGNIEQARGLIDVMTKDGCTPNICTYNAVINGLCKKGRVGEAYKLVKAACRQGLSLDKVSYTILISEHCRQGQTAQALELFDEMVEAGCSPDIHTYTTLIASSCKERKIEESEKLFDECLTLGLVPTKQTYSSMISGYCKVGKASAGMKIFEKMIKNGCIADSVTYGALISGLCKESRLEEARVLYDAMLAKGLVPCEVTRVTLAYEYCKNDRSDTALSILDRLDKKHWIRTTNILVRKLCSEGEVESSSIFLDKMLDGDYAVDQITCTAFVSACYNRNKYSMASAFSERISKKVPSSLYTNTKQC
ncbi:hypothetical protein J5N97_005700 [Dioscorea zingiberensis]|uniref:Pentatricopeptide repeat-containing protein n=1 Tax=Dioscorea zingiberensis TaxID=325984 RepID=A0A9D5D9I4_9LILI|nr:hypothetical protein J5N97_005700 [Dioscorea zingiberensis]